MAPVVAYVLVRPFALLRRPPLKRFEQCPKEFPFKRDTFRCFRSNKEEGKSLSTKEKKVNLLPIEEGLDAETTKFRGLLKPFLFTVSVCGCSYVGATLWQYENVRKYALQFQSLDPRPRTNYKVSSLRQQLNMYWNKLSEGQKVATGIIAVNSLVLLLWRIPGLQSTMLKYFTANPASKTVCLPMLLSTFSHYSLFHFAANMFVLYSFSTTAVNLFGKEQFLGFYLSAGVVSSFVSYLHKVLIRSPSLSLGASGALMGVLSAVCFQFPHAQLAIVFLPFFTFQAGIAIKCVMALDAVGLALRWKTFDHAAHLGGSIFGAIYLWYGQELVWKKREPLLHWWHSIRDKSNTE